MSTDAPSPPLLVVLGPTGSGKSALALALARQFPAEIVNCDSLQVYRYFNIGTAKMPPAERDGVPHHLLDIVDPDQLFTAGEYARRARPLLHEIAARRRLPIVVGGTGFYLRALLDGLCPAPGGPDTMLVRQRLAARELRRPGSLARLLARLDPPAAARIHGHDIRKLVRALQVRLESHRPLTALHAVGREPLRGFRVQKVGLNPPRPQLRERIDARCRQMFDNGLENEVEHILALGYPPAVKPFESLGYAQVLALRAGQVTRDAALADTQVKTRQYAKRQMTWFRREADVAWFEAFGDAPETQHAVLQILSPLVANFFQIPRSMTEQIGT